MAKKHIGKCRLTGDLDRFVESHLLPKALTRPEKPGIPFIEGGKGGRPKRSWSSWTDKRLVTRRGENILRDLDTWAIPILRSHKLVWSGWHGAATLPADQHIREGGKGARFIAFEEPQRMRLFFLSLLWRAAASQIPAMADVSMSNEDLDRLTSMILRGDATPLSFYPAALVQLSTRGETHNQTPFATNAEAPVFEPGQVARVYPQFRFYLDGLVIRFYRPTQKYNLEEIQEICVGQVGKTPIPTMTYETSFQNENLLRMQYDAHTNFAEVVDKLAWPPARLGQDVPLLSSVSTKNFG